MDEKTRLIQGELSRRLAARADSVLGLDLSPNMIRVAKERSTHFSNIDYVVADVLTYDLPPHHFDAILSVATLHHMDLAAILTKLKTALAPGGALAILDLYKYATIGDYLSVFFAVPLARTLRRQHADHVPQPLEARAAWETHGRHDVYLTLPEVRRICAPILPGAVVRRHLLWRYSLIWKKPAG
jgi:SAM-dependent methyltransferase